MAVERASRRDKSSALSLSPAPAHSGAAVGRLSTRPVSDNRPVSYTAGHVHSPAGVDRFSVRSAIADAIIDIIGTMNAIIRE